MEVEPTGLADVLNVVDEREDFVEYVWGLKSWVNGEAIPEMENSGEGTVCKFISFQMN